MPPRQIANTLFYKIISSPVGSLTLVASDKALVYLGWGAKLPQAIAKNLELASPSNCKLLQDAETQLNEYFLGKRTSFDIPVAPSGTEFQKRAWAQLLDIPYGSTISYRQQASMIGKPTAARAIGAANGKNPIAIIVPCHRVIGVSGKLTGFAGGLGIKQKLLAFEKYYLKD
jgi:methylated-DNA-[protein]-cysteine S-methyltransferase